VLCGFVMALAQWQQGDETRAMHYFERARAACGPANLYAEEFDVQQRQLRGNLPQAFTHATMLEAAQRLPHPPAGPTSRRAHLGVPPGPHSAGAQEDDGVGDEDDDRESG
jgi:hypothetical protein